MNSHKTTHLNETQVLQAITGEAEVHNNLQDHLADCPLCRADKEQLEQDLKRLGRMAKHFAPSPLRKIHLPAKESSSLLHWSWNWRPALQVAISAAIIVMVMWPGVIKVPSKQGDQILPEEIWQTDELMEDVALLTENALPDVYQDIAGEHYSGID
ncbi:MAG: hypothetical protein GY864_05630, partial [Desulfobacterales bacterium]|nr:hypothetical protein [Desulfobacterales bacterium]